MTKPPKASAASSRGVDLVAESRPTGRAHTPAPASAPPAGSSATTPTTVANPLSGVETRDGTRGMGVLGPGGAGWQNGGTDMMSTFGRARARCVLHAEVTQTAPRSSWWCVHTRIATSLSCGDFEIRAYVILAPLVCITQDQTPAHARRAFSAGRCEREHRRHPPRAHATPLTPRPRLPPAARPCAGAPPSGGRATRPSRAPTASCAGT